MASFAARPNRSAPNAPKGAPTGAGSPSTLAPALAVSATVLEGPTPEDFLVDLQLRAANSTQPCFNDLIIVLDKSFRCVGRARCL
jgi:hypothetical protein